MVFCTTQRTSSNSLCNMWLVKKKIHEPHIQVPRRRGSYMLRLNFQGAGTHAKNSAIEEALIFSGKPFFTFSVI